MVCNKRIDREEKEEAVRMASIKINVYVDKQKQENN